MNVPQKSIAIVGGGITGMAAAHAAQDLLSDFRIILLEPSDRLGGVLQTESVDGYLIEKSADMFATDPPFAMELCEQLGKTSELISTKAIKDRAFVATGDAIHPVPRGLSLMLPGNLDAIRTSPLLDEAAKVRFMEEREIARRPFEEDEGLESFAVRRFGRSAFDYLIQPLVGGIYTADPAKLSMNATMARFVEMEKIHGSLIGAAAAANKGTVDEEASGARYGMFRAPEHGIGQLVEWIEEALTNVEVRTGCRVCALTRSDSNWSVAVRRDDSGPETLGPETLGPEPSGPETISVDAIVLATPAAVSGQLLQSVDRPLAEKLAAIESASSAIVVLGVDQTQLIGPFDGYGIIVPSVLNRQVIATSFSSNKFAGRAPDGKLLIRSFIGGALQSELVDLSDQELVNIATSELKTVVGLTGVPEISRVYRWRNCMPQYHLGHLDRVDQIESLISRHVGLELAGNSYRGVGIPACIQSGRESVGRLAKRIAAG